MIVLTVLVAAGLLRRLDRSVLDLAQSVRATWLDVFSSAVSMLGQAEVTAGLALGLAVARWRRRLDTWTVPLLLAVVTAVEVALKLTVPQPPPPDELSRSIELVPFVHAPFPGAFPSGHVARTAFLAGIVALPVWLTAAVVALMALTRVYLAEHWPADVLGGLLLGLLVAQAARVAEGRLRRH